MRTLLALAIGLMSLSALAEIDRASMASKNFCEKRSSDPHALQTLITDYNNQLYFMNEGGLFGGGVCWWHSRFTRSALYLAVFDPSLPKPSDAEAREIIGRIRDRKGITLVPGFKNLRDFSLAYRDEIQHKLNDWQKSDGVLKAAWVQGLSGKPAVDAAQLEKIMDETYERVQKGEVLYQMLQMKGIDSHAWLVVGMEKLSDGYKLTVIDSNTGTDTFTYQKGMTNFPYHGWYSFVPYTHQVKEERKLSNKFSDFCTGKKVKEEKPQDNQQDSPEET
ncbi:MAG: hypothetical protein ACJ76H_15040 [Bacteriovoracaceae bacterium]